MAEPAVTTPPTTGVKTIGYKNIAKMHTFKDMNLLGTVFRIPISTITTISIRTGSTVVPEYVVVIATTYGTEEKTLTAPVTIWAVSPSITGRFMKRKEPVPELLTEFKSAYGDPGARPQIHANILVAMSLHNAMCNDIVATATGKKYGFKYIEPQG